MTSNLDTADWPRYRLPPVAAVPAESALPAEVLPAEDAAAASLVRQNAAWFCRLRWMVVAALLAAAAAGLLPRVQQALGVRIAPLWPLALAAVLTAANLVYGRLLRGNDTPASLRRLVWAQIGVDLVAATVVVHYLGSQTTYAPFLYVVHIVLSCMFLSGREGLAIALAAAALYAGLLAVEAVGAWPAESVFVHSGRTAAGLQLAALLAMWAVIWALVSRLAGRLHLRERELAAANARLSASSDERMRHMLQTTHQLKAPFAAIDAQTQLLLDGTVGPLPEAATRLVQKISDRARLLSQQIHDMLQLANLRSQSQALPPRQPLDLAALVESAIARIAPTARLRKVGIEAELPPAPIVGREDHLKMVLDNLLANAVNYSTGTAPVAVRLAPRGDGRWELSITDGGIGIAAEKLPSIFDDYYRTAEAARHNPASTGLGLAIVRDVARANSIEVEVASRPGCGTRFLLIIPSGRQGGSSTRED